MALNKRKVLETARKHAQKGAKAKALKEYNKLLKADPRDAKLLLEVGDAYRRWGQAEEAIAQYGKVAQQYRQDGFDARAVAVFKQILNLDPKHYAAYVSLSELYQRMGLDSEAISALQTAADGYHKEGRKAEALDLLRQTAALDPTNTTSRLKVAELLRQEGMNSEALAEYNAVVEELESQGDREQVLVVLDRVLELNADDVGALTSLVKNLMAASDFDRAEGYAIRLIKASAEPSQYELLMDLYSQSGDEQKLSEATRGLAKLHRDRGDEEKARDLMQRLPVDEVGSNSRLAVDVSEVAEPDLGDDDLLEEEPFLALEDEPVADLSTAAAEPELDLGADEIELELEPEEPQAGDVVEPDALPEGDPDQLLAEANVYLRYGKGDQAIASLRGVLAQDPVHRGALEKLGEAYAADGQNESAVEAWVQAAVQVREAGDAEALSVLKDRVAALDPAAAEQMGSVEVASNGADDGDSEVGLELELDVEVDLDLDTAIGEVAGSETQSGLSFDTKADIAGDATVDADESDDSNDLDEEFEIEVDDEPFEIDVDEDIETEDLVLESEEPSAPISEASQTEPDLSADEGEEVSIETEMDLGSDDSQMDDESVEFDFDVDELSDSEPESSTGQSTTTTAKIAEELEEAEFYLAQDMYDEAEEILSRVLELVPNHPSAMLRMGELEAARGQAPGLDLADESAEASPVDAAELTMDGLAPDVVETQDDVETQDVDPEEVAAAAVDEDTSEDVAAEEPESVDVVAEESDEEVTATSVSEDTASDEVSESPSAEVEADDGDSFDLREALADVLSDDEELPGGDDASGTLSTVEDGFGSIFSDFKKGVTATLGEGDFETRYDLGIAYREMGLFEDALGEFRVCLDSKARRFDSLHLMGVLCARSLAIRRGRQPFRTSPRTPRNSFGEARGCLFRSFASPSGRRGDRKGMCQFASDP